MGMTRKVTLVEVGPRDGFQNVKETIATEDKIAIIRGMMESGVRREERKEYVDKIAAVLILQNYLDSRRQ